MFRKSFISFLFIITVVIAASVNAFAQFAPVSGTVELEKADGTREPVVGALIEVYRTDIKASLPSSKTNKKGEFVFAGLPYGAQLVFGVSAPNCSPLIFPNVKAGQERLLIILSPGDGGKLTEDEVRKGAAARASSTTGEARELTAEEKKARADLEAKNKEITAKNEKALKTNEIVARAIKEGNDAFTAKNYDLAIAKYDEGIAADPAYVGSAPTFYSNRGAALTTRGVETYNKAVKSTDVSEKVNFLGMARKDFADAAQGYLSGWNVLKNAPAADIVDRNNYDATKLGVLRGAKETFMKAVRTEQVDNAVIEAAKILIPEFLNAETDAAKKAEAALTLADLYRVVGDSENAIAAYKKILETSPDNPDALAGAGLSLVNLGYLNNDKTKLQEGANFLQKFASIAPDTHKFKADAVALIDTLKKESNVTPQKAGTVKKRP